MSQLPKLMRYGVEWRHNLDGNLEDEASWKWASSCSETVAKSERVGRGNPEEEVTSHSDVFVKSTRMEHASLEGKRVGLSRHLIHVGRSQVDCRATEVNQETRFSLLLLNALCSLLFALAQCPNTPLVCPGMLISQFQMPASRSTTREHCPQDSRLIAPVQLLPVY
jgi:hypothetical protein